MTDRERAGDYKLIPMSKITDEARKIAVLWMECEDKDWIGQKHKLASDIMNYAIKFRNEGLREELIKFTRIFCDGGYKHHLQTNVSMKDAISGMVDEYLKTK